jgi:hypothetical protein
VAKAPSVRQKVSSIERMNLLPCNKEVLSEKRRDPPHDTDEWEGRTQMHGLYV